VWELAAFLLLCGALALEKRRNDRALSSFRAVIHVNGIRGKTSTCRLLDAARRDPHYLACSLLHRCLCIAGLEQTCDIQGIADTPTAPA